jgi:transcriptional regulator with XRE-family HTH domain
MHIGEEIRRRREEQGLTGFQLAVKAGMTPSAVSQIETGKRTPNSASVVKLATALGVEVGELYPKAQDPLWSDDSPAERRLDDEVALAILFRGLARRAQLIVERARREGPSAPLSEDLAALYEEQAALYRLRGRRDILGRESEELAEAADAYEEVESTIQAMLRQDLDATDTERREARRFRSGAEEAPGSQEADAS